MARKKKSSSLSTRGMMLFGLPFFAVGLFMGGCNAWTVTRHHAAQKWVEMPAVIQTAKLERHESDDSTTYKAVATYTYELAGRQYTGDRVSLHSGSDNIGDFQRDAYTELKRHLDAGTPFRCYVNPNDPQESVLYRHLRWEMMLVFAVFAAVFGSVGVGMFVGAWAQRYRPATTPAGQVPDDQPWCVRTDWAAGRIPADCAAVVVPVMSVLTIWWILVSLPLMVALPVMFEEAGTRWVWLALVVPAIGAVLVLVTLYQAVRRRKFGESVFEMACTPGVVGGPLAGVVRIPADVRPDDGFRIALCCLRRTKDSDDKVQESAVWNDEQQVTRTLDDGRPGETAVPVLLALPYDAKPSSPPSDETGIRWSLTVAAEVPGVNFQAEFDVPVFKTADSRANFQLDPELAGDYLSQPDVASLLAADGIGLEPLGAGGVRLVFGALRNPGMAITLGLFTAGWTAVVWLLLHLGAPIVFPIVFGLLDLVLIWITLNLWFYRSVVEASSQGLYVRGGWLGLGIGRLFPPDVITRFEAKQNMSSGRHVWNTIYVHFKARLKRTVATSIGSRAVERAVIDELETALGRKSRDGSKSPADAGPQLWMDAP